MSTIKGRLEQKNPYWRVRDTDVLAQTITGVCNIRREIADQIVREMMDSDSKTAQFETQTVLTGKPNLSRTRSTWVAREVTWTGISKHTEYELERKLRTEG